VLDEATGTVLGTTSYHDILPAVKRVEIGYTWYARRCQRTHVNTTCQAADDGPRLRHAGLPRGGLAHRQLQLRVAAAIERLGARRMA
jgi:hypothetical protein